MMLRRLRVAAVALATWSSSVARADDAPLPPTCADGVKDGAETDVDCGGAACDAIGKTCGPGKSCSANADCAGAGGGVCDVGGTNTCGAGAAFVALRAAAAGLFVVAAANHAILAARGEDVVWRHELFAGIDLAAATGLLGRPKWMLVPLALLACQQVPSHGSDFVRSTGTRAVDWPSLGVVLFFPAVLTLLVVERTRE